MDSSRTRRVPLILEALFSIIVCVTIYPLTLGSPRYYIMRGERDAARRVVVKYHTSSRDVNEAIIGVTVSQIDVFFLGRNGDGFSGVFFPRVTRLGSWFLPIFCSPIVEMVVVS